VREILLRAGADARGEDAQTDTYFAVPEGRLKVREGSIENALIAYARPDLPGAKPCDVTMTELDRAASGGVREILEASLPVLVRVRKRREILFIGNVKFHLDTVEGLGTFVEIEAQAREGTPARAVLEAQAAEWRERLGIADADLEPQSYSDLLQT